MCVVLQAGRADEGGNPKGKVMRLGREGRILKGPITVWAGRRTRIDALRRPLRRS